MASPSHSRQSSNENAGAGYSMILEHTLQYSGTYELPLQTMFALNSNPQPAAQRDAQAATAQFTSAMINQISRLPSQPCSLPPSFVTDFVRRCFTSALEEVDFPQALTSLDYLRDLERRRNREKQKALQRLGLESEQAPSRHAERMQRKDPRAAEWLRKLDNADRKIEASYTQLYIVLRRWILINELSLQPFHKHNCLAMLNTLYPPITTTAPTSFLTPQILSSQREIFFKYVKSVEKNGIWVLDDLMQHGKDVADENGWPAARRTLDLYLRLANAFLSETYGIGYHDESFQPVDKPVARRKERKADSGVSFNSRPSSGRRSSATSDTTSSAMPSPTFFNASAPIEAPKPPDLPTKGLSKLERIAYELRRIKSRAKATESDKENESTMHSRRHQQQQSPQSEHSPPLPSPLKKKSSVGGSLRKLRSLGDLKSAANRGVSSSLHRVNTSSDRPPAGVETFDKDEMKRQRLRYEANVTKALPRPPNEI